MTDHLPNDYDAIVVGSRCGGAPTAMLLARQGRRVLLVDRATFPSDVMSGHTIQPAGMARLASWGLLDRVEATGVPFADRIRFDFGAVVLDGTPAPIEGQQSLVCIRRTVLDPLLADAAAEAGAEVRFGVSVTGLLRDDDGRVTGIVGHDGQGEPVTATASIVIGADGVNSFVARAVDAPRYQVSASTTVTAYTYWRGLDVDHVELYARPGRAFIVTPTNDDLTLVAVQWPIADGARVSAGVEDAYFQAIAEVPRLAAMLATGQRVERFRYGRIHDGFFRQAGGPGWALVGDAGYHKDPITAQGMLDAFRDAERLAAAVDAGLAAGGGAVLDAELAAYQADRDAAALPVYEFTCGIAELAPPTPELQGLLAAMEGRPEPISRFLGIMAGSVSVAEFFAPESLAAIAGVAA